MVYRSIERSKYSLARCYLKQRNCSFFINLRAHIALAVNGHSEFNLTRLGLVEAVFTHGCDSYIRMIVKLSRRFL